MKALVLSGGEGTRLRPFSHSVAKQLIPIVDKPVLVHCLENIRSIGVRDVGIVVANNSDEIVETLGDGSWMGLNVTYIHQESPLGLAHCVSIAGEYLGDEDFVLYLGDNMLPSGIDAQAEEFRRNRPDAQILVSKVEEPSCYGIAEVDTDGVVHGLTEKPTDPRSDLAVVGVYFFTSVIHEVVRAIRPSWRNELEITDALQHLVDLGRNVVAGEYQEYWQDAGSIGGLLKCNRAMLSQLAPRVCGEVDEESSVLGPVVVAPGAVVTRSRLTGPLYVGPEARVSDSRVGPNSALSGGCLVQQADIEDCMLLGSSSVAGLSLRLSVVGRWASASSTEGVEHTQLTIGDHARAVVSA